MQLLKAIVAVLRAFLSNRSALALENLALRHQFTVLHRTAKRPKLRRRDRIFWTWLARLWPAWKSALLIVQPETVVRWHRLGFRLYWRWKSRREAGRPKIALEVRELIRQMSRENPTWRNRRSPSISSVRESRRPSRGVPS